MAELLCVVSPGRSGSTFLQRLLNTQEQVALFGEHGGFLTGLSAAFASLAAPRTVALIETGRRYLDHLLEARPVAVTPGGWSIEWTNAFRSSDVAPAFARLVKDLVYPAEVRSPRHRYWGFKEIRYGVAEIAFLRDLFPGARFIFLLRDPVAVYRSQCALGWGRDLGPARAAAEFHHRFHAVADAWAALEQATEDRGSDHARLVCYERLAVDPLGHLRAIADWLKIAPFDEAKVRAVRAARLTPGLARWSAEAETFLDAYVSLYANQDRDRHAALVSRAMRAAATQPAIGSYRIERSPVAEARVAVAATATPGDRAAAGAYPEQAIDAPRVVGQHGGTRDRKLVFVEIPSEEATTLSRQIAAALDAREICPYRDGFPRACAAGELGSYRYFFGRFSFADVARIPGEKFIVTVLGAPRQPALPPPCAATAGAHGTAAAGQEGPDALAEGQAAADAGGHRRDAHAGLSGDRMARHLAWTITADESGAATEDPAEPGDVLDLALQAVSRFDLIGFADELDLAYARIAHELGLPQAPGALHGTASEAEEASPELRRHRLGPSWADPADGDDHDPDRLVYDAAKAQFGAHTSRWKMPEAAQASAGAPKVRARRRSGHSG